MTRTLLTFALIILTSASIFAQSGYNLKECINYSLKHNLSNQICENNIRIAGDQLHQTASGYLPQINGSIATINNLKLATTTIPAGTISKNEMDVQFGTRFNTNLSVDVSQTIYDQSKIFRIKTGYLNSQIAYLQKRQNRENQIYTTSIAYFQVLIFNELKNRLQNNIGTYDKLIKITNLQYEKGVALKTDVQRLTVVLNSTRFQLDDAVTQYKTALNNLKNTMGLPIDTTLTLDNLTDWNSFVELPEESRFVPDSLFEYEINRITTSIQKMTYYSKAAAFVPTVSIFAHWANQTKGDNFSQSLNEWDDNSYAGFSLAIPLFDGLYRMSAVNENKLNYQNARLNLELNRQTLELRHENAYKELLTSYHNLLNNKANLELAQEILEKTNLAYQRGAGSLTDFLSDDNALKNAQSDYINSLYKFMSGKLDYEKSNGTLNSFFNQLKSR